MKILLLTLIFLVSCVKTGGPEQVLKEYANKRFNNELTREDFQEYFDGEILADFEVIDQKALGELNQINTSKTRKMDIEFKRCDEVKCFLTYSIVYSTQAESNNQTSDVQVKIKKIAELKKIEDKWKITGITDIKTHYDFGK